MRQYHQEGNNRLQENLKLSCHAANRVRHAGLQSYTHPHSNLLSEHERKQLDNSIIDLRKNIGYQYLQNRHTGFISPEKAFQKLQDENQLVLQAKVGDCWEFATLAMEYLRERHHAVRIERVGFENGDHIFLVIGRDRGKINDLTSWGSQAVICDAWAGAVYPVSVISSQLRDYRRALDAQNNADYAFTYSFNPKFHRFVCDLELAPLPEAPTPQHRMI